VKAYIWYSFTLSAWAAKMTIRLSSEMQTSTTSGATSSYKCALKCSFNSNDYWIRYNCFLRIDNCIRLSKCFASVFQQLSDVQHLMFRSLLWTRRIQTSQLQFEFYATTVTPLILWICSTTPSTPFAPAVGTGQHSQSFVNVSGVFKQQGYSIVYVV